jgi:hypothetical protein
MDSPFPSTRSERVDKGRPAEAAATREVAGGRTRPWQAIPAGQAAGVSPAKHCRFESRAELVALAGGNSNEKSGADQKWPAPLENSFIKMVVERRSHFSSRSFKRDDGRKVTDRRPVVFTGFPVLGFRDLPRRHLRGLKRPKPAKTTVFPAFKLAVTLLSRHFTTVSTSAWDQSSSAAISLTSSPLYCGGETAGRGVSGSNSISPVWRLKRKNFTR